MSIGLFLALAAIVLWQFGTIAQLRSKLRSEREFSETVARQVRADVDVAAQAAGQLRSAVKALEDGYHAEGDRFFMLSDSVADAPADQILLTDWWRDYGRRRGGVVAQVVQANYEVSQSLGDLKGFSEWLLRARIAVD